jgi:hypothetical protein
MNFGSTMLAALLLGATTPVLGAPPAYAQASTSMAPLCDALDAWVHDPVGAVNETLIQIDHNQNDEAATWAQANAQRVVNNTVYEYVRSRPEKDLNLTEVESDLTDAITAVVDGPADAQEAARQRLGHPIAIDLPAFLARAVPSCGMAGTPRSGE